MLEKQSGVGINGTIPLTYIDDHYIERLKYLLHGPIELPHDDGMAWCGMLSQPEYIDAINNTVSNYDVQSIIDNVSVLSLQYSKIISELEALNAKVEKIGTKDDIAESVVGAISKSYVPNTINASKLIEIESNDQHIKTDDISNYSASTVQPSSTRNNVIQLMDNRPAVPFSEILLNLNDVINTFLDRADKKAATIRYNADHKKIKRNDLIKDEVIIDLNNSILVHSMNILERYYIMHRLSTDVTTCSKTLIPAETVVYNLIKDHFYFGAIQRLKITFHLNDLYYSVDGFSFYKVHSMLSRKSDSDVYSRQVGLISVRHPFINPRHPSEDGISGGRYYRSVLVFNERDNCIGVVHIYKIDSLGQTEDLYIVYNVKNFPTLLRNLEIRFGPVLSSNSFNNDPHNIILLFKCTLRIDRRLSFTTRTRNFFSHVCDLCNVKLELYDLCLVISQTTCVPYNYVDAFQNKTAIIDNLSSMNVAETFRTINNDLIIQIHDKGRTDVKDLISAGFKEAIYLSGRVNAEWGYGFKQISDTCGKIKRSNCDQLISLINKSSSINIDLIHRLKITINEIEILNPCLE
ncbi:hypothetical protein FQA39_LY17574 [Lamprigera yunnana]|nr:hypothetical protein FQA39_LY17574 [Lamprigera yunnana]